MRGNYPGAVVQDFIISINKTLLLIGNLEFFIYLFEAFIITEEAVCSSDSHLPKKIVLFASKPFKNEENCFLFHLKSSIRSQEI